eukprot:gnl/Chilomastix_caulleri/4011.p1 GENE.gnl/Chilomastix_caulleri/4011~~gnl/Chilomastix_caulleri/4011.p1  ORF type:complete len:50 (+),score=9.54 gnl/Chilomastix_caulleri/4011:89-238(+)
MAVAMLDQQNQLMKRHYQTNAPNPFMGNPNNNNADGRGARMRRIPVGRL